MASDRVLAWASYEGAFEAERFVVEIERGALRLIVPTLGSKVVHAIPVFGSVIVYAAGLIAAAVVFRGTPVYVLATIPGLAVILVVLAVYFNRTVWAGLLSHPKDVMDGRVLEIGRGWWNVRLRVAVSRRVPAFPYAAPGPGSTGGEYVEERWIIAARSPEKVRRALGLPGSSGR